MTTLHIPTDPLAKRDPLRQCDNQHLFRGSECPLCVQGEIIPPEDPITQVARTPQKGKEGRSTR